MQIKWNEVTWYSKFLAIIFFLGVLPVLAFCIGMQYEKVAKEANSEYGIFPVEFDQSKIPPSDNNSHVYNPPQSGYTLIGQCNSEACLYEGPAAIEGYGKIIGYHHTYQKEDFLGEESICTAIIVTGGSEPLIENLLQWVKDGNTINGSTEDGKLILNINLPTQLEKLTSLSTPENLIELGVIRKTPEGRGAAPCESFVDVISVKSI